MKNIYIFGDGELADIAYYYLKNDTTHFIKGFLLSESYLRKDSFKGLPILIYEEIEKTINKDENFLFMPLSFKKMNSLREKFYLDAKSKGFKFISYISTKANINNSIIGENCMILEYNNIQPETVIGNNNIIWSSNHIGHHTHIGNNNFISSHVVISGAVKIGNNCFFGVNSSVSDNINIDDFSIVGQNASVIKSIPTNTIVLGAKSDVRTIKSTKLIDF